MRLVDPLRILAAEARQRQARVAALVNPAYGLTPKEVALMWRTSPPRRACRERGRPCRQRQWNEYRGQDTMPL